MSRSSCLIGGFWGSLYGACIFCFGSFHLASPQLQRFSPCFWLPWLVFLHTSLFSEAQSGVEEVCRLIHDFGFLLPIGGRTFCLGIFFGPWVPSFCMVLGEVFLSVRRRFTLVGEVVRSGDSFGSFSGAVSGSCTSVAEEPRGDGFGPGYGSLVHGPPLSSGPPSPALLGSAVSGLRVAGSRDSAVLSGTSVVASSSVLAEGYRLAAVLEPFGCFSLTSLAALPAFSPTVSLSGHS